MTTTLTPTPVEPKPVRFFRVLLAVQAFAGKPLRATQFAEHLTTAELDAMEVGLARMASAMHELVAVETEQELATEINALGDQIQRRLEG